MKKATRQILFYFFAAAFFVSAPLVVLYTAGFRISLNNQRIQQTGAVAVSTTPRGATVSIDGRTASGKTPTVVQNILPSDVTVRLEKKGYIPWEQVVHVDAGQTTYITSLLFTDLAPELLSSFTKLTTSFAHSANGRFLATLSRLDSDIEISVHEVVTGNTNIVTSFTHGSGEYSLEWLEDVHVIILMHNGEPEVGYLMTGERIEGAQLESLVSPPAPVRFIDNGENIEVRAGDSEKDRLVALLPKGTYTVKEDDDDYVLVQDSRKMLYLISLTSSDVVALDVPAVHYDWLSDENLLVWSDGLEVNTYDAETKERTFLTRQSELIMHLFWHPSTRAVIIGTENHVTAIETEEYKDRVHTFLVISEGRLTEVWLDSTGKNLYYVEETPENVGLYRRRLIK